MFIVVIQEVTDKISDAIEICRQRLEKDALAKHLGIKLTEIKPGYARATLRVTPELLNGAGLTHGSTVFALADIVFAAASNSHGSLALALTVSINFLKATTEGAILTGVATEQNRTRKTGLYLLEVRDENNDLVALADGMVYIKSSKK
jgi:acyl-CoA thioesterase